MGIKVCNAAITCSQPTSVNDNDSSPKCAGLLGDNACSVKIMSGESNGRPDLYREGERMKCGIVV